MAAVQRSKILLLPVHLHGGTKYIRSLHNNAAIENGYTVSKRRPDRKITGGVFYFGPTTSSAEKSEHTYI